MVVSIIHSIKRFTFPNSFSRFIIHFEINYFILDSEMKKEKKKNEKSSNDDKSAFFELHGFFRLLKSHNFVNNNANGEQKYLLCTDIFSQNFDARITRYPHLKSHSFRKCEHPSITGMRTDSKAGIPHQQEPA